jgi:glycosyltransferase involved in cell wall biosynthesis
MNVLIVTSGNKLYRMNPFVEEQGECLRRFGISIDYFLIKGKGLIGYMRNYPKLIERIRNGGFDLIHAHYGLSGMLSVLQRKIPVIITFHGTDINKFNHRIISRLAMILSRYKIFVHVSIKEKVNAKRNYSIIPCGVNLETFYPIDKSECRDKLKIHRDEKVVIFASSTERSVKNFPLAQKALSLLEFPVKLVALSGYTRNEVNLLMNAGDLLLLTSFNEGSPMVVKEAMATNLPIVSTNVGDVGFVIDNTKGCYIANYTPRDVADKIKKALNYGERTKGRDRISILGLDTNTVTKKIIRVYEELIMN